MKFSYQESFKKYFELVKKNRWLPIIGILTAGASGGNLNFPTNWMNSGSESSTTSENAKTVLGTATENLFINVNPMVWVILGLVIFLLVILFVVVYWIYASWSMSAMISAMKLANENKEVNLKIASKEAIKHIKPMIKLMLYSVFKYFFKILIVLIPALLIFVLISVISTIVEISWLSFAIGLPLALFTIAYYIYITVIFALLPAFSNRLLVISNESYKDSFKKGYLMAKKNFRKGFSLGFLNFLVGTVLSLGVIVSCLILYGLPVYLLISLENTVVTVLLGTFLVISGLIGIYGLIYLFGGFNAIKFGIWNDLYEELNNS